jgi:hypothetical protein
MTNRHERRKANRGKFAIAVDLCRLLPEDPNQGLTMTCWLCGATHQASGLARIQDKQSTTVVPLCDACLKTPAVMDRVMRKHLGTPDQAITTAAR